MGTFSSRKVSRDHYGWFVPSERARVRSLTPVSGPHLRHIRTPSNETSPRSVGSCTTTGTWGAAIELRYVGAALVGEVGTLWSLGTRATSWPRYLYDSEFGVLGSINPIGSSTGVGEGTVLLSSVVTAPHGCARACPLSRSRWCRPTSGRRPEGVCRRYPHDSGPPAKLTEPKPSTFLTTLGPESRGTL